MKQHQADKYDQNREHNQKELATMQMQAFEAAREKVKKTHKKAIVEYKKLASNLVMLDIFKIFPDSGLLTAAGTKLTFSEETVFRVLMVGKQTDEYHMTVEPGDLVLISQSGAIAQGHVDTTKILIPGGEEITGYYLTQISNIMAVVDYKRTDEDASKN